MDEVIRALPLGRLKDNPVKMYKENRQCVTCSFPLSIYNPNRHCSFCYATGKASIK